MKESKMTEKYAWIIDKDHTDFVGGGLLVTENMDEHVANELLKDGKGLKFRLYDDDKILYYEGRMVGDFEGVGDFDPLDWAMYNAGCTGMKTYYKGKWEWL